MRIEHKKYIIDNDKNINIKIAHISDIHFAHNYNIKRLDKITKKINEIKPNYICITGDIIDIYDAVNDASFNKLKEFINNLSNIGKTIISIGNHEHVKKTKKGYTKTDNIEWLKKLENKNIKILDNEIFEEDNISFIGYNPSYDFYYKDKEKHPEKNNKEIEKLIEQTKNKYKILLLHTPIQLFRKENYKNIKNFKKINITLCGHTHGGLTPSFIPGHFGIISPTKKLFQQKMRGITKINNNYVIINSGIMKLSRKSKITHLNNIYSSNIIEITIQNKKK